MINFDKKIGDVDESLRLTAPLQPSLETFYSARFVYPEPTEDPNIKRDHLSWLVREKEG